MNDVVFDTHDALNERLGFPVPATFFEVGRRLAASAAASDQVTEFFDQVCQLMLGGPELRYTATPAELFPFGTMGVDGVHYGYVIHAPELAQSDYPVAEYCPMDSTGVALIGADTPSAFEMMLSCWLERRQDRRDTPPTPVDSLAAVVRSALGIDPHEDKAEHRYDASGNALRVSPEVPSGWRFVATEDGVGVLAPEDAFAQSAVVSGGEAEAGVNTARALLGAGSPGSALVVLRELFWAHWSERDVALRLLEELAGAYEALGRPLLADISRSTAEKLRDRPVIKIPVPS